MSSKVNEFVVQYKFEIKKPNPNIHPMLNETNLSFEQNNNVHRRAGYEKKFMQNKLQGGRLKEDIRPNKNTNVYNRILFLFNKVNLIYENISILIFLF